MRSALAAAEEAQPLGQDPMVTLVETIEALSLARTVEQVADVVRSAARRITGADGIAFVLNEGAQVRYVDEDAIGPLWKGRSFARGDCVSGLAMDAGRSLVIPDVFADPRLPHDAYRPTFVKSLVMTPIRPDDPLGAIGAYWKTARTPDPAEVVHLEVMARATAAALQNALTYASLAEALERREFLMRELDHRCKNTLAAVQSIADQTLRRAETPAQFVDSFTGRLGSLARAHELLTRKSWGRLRLEELLEGALEPFTGRPERIAIAGPALTLSPESAVAMHMTVHELAMNAARYGALSADAGQVSITWTVDDTAAAPQLTLVWRETGGPPVCGSSRSGFGLRLMRTGVARELGGRAEVDLQAGGLVFKLEAPLSERISLA